MAKYVWLNIKTGEFSNSWNEDAMKLHNPLKEDAEVLKSEPHWKLIQYECLSDPKFEFYAEMQLR